MAYQALYRKWRPKVFEDVVGQQHIVETIKNQISSGKIAHAYLFCGSRGTGKTSTAKILSRAVNCKNPVNGNPCNECESCRGINNGSIFDVVEIDGASNNKVDDVRNLRDEVLYPPADVKYKVYIIDEVHMLTTEAFNALLKTLEEPPSYVIFILATTEFHKIPATIISRCQKFDFRRISFKDTARRIGEVAAMDGIEVTSSAVNLLAKAADGSLRDGLSKLDQCMALGLSKIDYKDVAELIGASDPEFLSELCDLIIDEKLSEALKLLDDGINKGIDPVRLYSDMADYFRDLMMYKATQDSSLLTNAEQEITAKYAAQAKRITLARILRISESLAEGMNSAKYTLSPKLAFEITLLKISSAATNPDIEGILERLEKLENTIKNISMGNVVIKEQSGIYETKTTEETNNTEHEYEEFPPAEVYDIPAKLPYDPEEERIVDPYSATESYQVDEYDGEDMNSYEIKPQADEDADIVADINNNLKEILSCAKNADMGFNNIIKKADILYENGSVILSFSESVNYDIAAKFGYNRIMSQALSDYFGKNINVELKHEKKIQESMPEEKDPLESLFALADENISLFNIED